jgi:hypothetical protein
VPPWIVARLKGPRRKWLWRQLAFNMARNKRERKAMKDNQFGR